MTPQQALNFLDQLASKAPVERSLHAQAQNAVKILNEAIAPKNPSVDPVQPLQPPKKLVPNKNP